MNYTDKIKSFVSNFNKESEKEITDKEINEIREQYQWNLFIETLMDNLSASKKLWFKTIKSTIDDLYLEVKAGQLKVNDIVDSISDFFKRTKIMIETGVELAVFTVQVIALIVLLTVCALIVMNPITWLPTILIVFWYASIFDDMHAKLEWKPIQPKEPISEDDKKTIFEWFLDVFDIVTFFQ